MPENPKMGSEEYFARLYEVEEEHWWSRGMREVAGGILDAHYRDARGLRVLDAGCGTGGTLNWLSRYQPRMAIGIDLFRQPLRFCRTRGAALLSQSSVMALPFSDESFDLIVCNDVIQHLPGEGADEMAFGEFYRVLEPGGCLLVRTNSRQGSREQNVAAAHHRLYQVAGLRAGLERAGFRVMKMTYANALMGVIPAVQRYLKRSRTSQHHQDHGLAIRLLPPRLRWLNRSLYWVMKLEAWLLSKPACASPFGQSIFCLAQKPERDK
jgi:ubiquinone/menaquinone biosynthesis C-methylase UbiE